MHFQTLYKRNHFVRIILQLVFPPSIVVGLEMMRCITVIHYTIYIFILIDGHLGFQCFVIIKSAAVSIVFNLSYCVCVRVSLHNVTRNSIVAVGYPHL